MIDQLAQWLENARHGVAITGAGVSTESGIPDFRSDTGMWTDVDPMDVASVNGFRDDPARFYRFWRSKFAALAAATPNLAHRLVAGLERRARIQTVITQNIDGLHQKAGSSNVLEVHGTFRVVTCLQCGANEPIEALFHRHEEPSTPPICRKCGAAQLKPNVVLFGEDLPPGVFAEAEAEVEQADVVLVMGTSLEVYPVAGLVPRAKRSGAKVAIINRDPTPFDEDVDLVLRAELGPTSRSLMAMLGLA